MREKQISLVEKEIKGSYNLFDDIRLAYKLLITESKKERIKHMLRVYAPEELYKDKPDLSIQSIKKSKLGKPYSKEVNELINKVHDQIFQKERLCALIKTYTPNLARLLPAEIIAQLLIKAGSLRQLAFLTSSKLQVLGAEKALNLAKQKETNTPKHGYLYAHPKVQNSPEPGKQAKKIANQASISARIDYFRPNEELSTSPEGLSL